MTELYEVVLLPRIVNGNNNIVLHFKSRRFLTPLNHAAILCILHKLIFQAKNLKSAIVCDYPFYLQLHIFYLKRIYVSFNVCPKFSVYFIFVRYFGNRNDSCRKIKQVPCYPCRPCRWNFSKKVIVLWEMNFRLRFKYQGLLNCFRKQYHRNMYVNHF